MLERRIDTNSMKRQLAGFLFLIVFIFFQSGPIALAFGQQEKTSAHLDTVIASRTGTASYYAAKFQGRRTSNGELLDNHAYTCASSRWEYDTWVRVTNLRNGKSVLVRITDRFRPGGSHLVDLTLCAAKDIDMVRHGIARVRVEVIRPEFVRDLLPKDTISFALPGPRRIPILPVKRPEIPMERPAR